MINIKCNYIQFCHEICISHIQMSVKYVLECDILHISFFILYQKCVSTVSMVIMHLIYLFATLIVSITVFFQVLYPQRVGKVGQLFCASVSHIV